MTDNNDRRLIEDYLPIEAISAEASREKSVRKGHISTLHLWWARRPLVACRAAVYGALVPAPVSKSGRGPKSDFVKRLCKYPGDPKVIAEAQRHILEAHAQRLSNELGKPVTVKDMEEGRAPRPKVLDMFAGGGAIPLEALRLGCEAYALELNPVAHIIELCTLVYPQKYCKPDKNAKGSAPDGTWAGLAKEVEHWGKWVLERVKKEIGDLYPPISDPKNPPQRLARQPQEEFETPGFQRAQQELTTSGSYLIPVAYLWTRTVHCKNPACGATVPLMRQAWLCKKERRYVALKMVAPRGERRVRFQVVEANANSPFDFDPDAGSKQGNAICPFCGTVADNDYIQAEGIAGQLGIQLMAVVCHMPSERGEVYLSAQDGGDSLVPDQGRLLEQISTVVRDGDVSVPDELLETRRPSPNARGVSGVTRYGLLRFGQLFTPRQQLVLLSLNKYIHLALDTLREEARPGEIERVEAVAAYLGLMESKASASLCNLARWRADKSRVEGIYGRQALAMVWDFAEVNPFSDVSGSFRGMVPAVVDVIKECVTLKYPGTVNRGNALELPYQNASIDAVITDPPYYDNIPYAELSDFFYVWLKRVLHNTHSEHFASPNAPRRQEIVALASRHAGDMKSAIEEYEERMRQAFAEAARVLKPKSPLVCIYAHKTTLGWATLVNALRKSGFSVTEAWPLDTEMGSRLIAMGASALASSIFLIARKREGHDVGNYDTDVRPELEAIVRERVETLWEQGVSGADLVIAAVGAGLRAFTRFARVEYANGEEMPAERFLAEVEGVVLETLLEKIFGLVGARVSQVDGPSQFYVLWRYAYHASELDAGEAIVFTYGLPVELDGPRGLSAGTRALVEKKKNKYQLRDYVDRGHDDRLGLPAQDGTLPPLIDVLHRVLYLMEHQPGALPQFLSESLPDLERLRLVANALAGPHLKGGENGAPHVATTAREQAALGKLVANWRSLMEGRITPEERAGVTRRLPGL
jgi:putative DNA methylase